MVPGRSSAHRKGLGASRSHRRGSPSRLARSNTRSVRLAPRERRRRPAIRGGLIEHESARELALYAHFRPCFTHFSIATPREFHSFPEYTAAAARELQTQTRCAAAARDGASHARADDARARFSVHGAFARRARDEPNENVSSAGATMTSDRRVFSRARCRRRAMDRGIRRPRRRR